MVSTINDQQQKPGRTETWGYRNNCPSGPEQTSLNNFQPIQPGKLKSFTRKDTHWNSGSGYPLKQSKSKVKRRCIQTAQTAQTKTT